MGDHNKILPKEKLSTRERVRRKVVATEGRPFTLKEINRLLRPRLKIDTLRFHVEYMAMNLEVEKLPRKGREPQLYVYRDVLAGIEQDSPLNGEAHELLKDLYWMANQLRQGHYINPVELVDKRERLHNTIAEKQAELDDLKKLHGCLDLWMPNTLVDRLGFIDKEGGE